MVAVNLYAMLHGDFNKFLSTVGRYCDGAFALSEGNSLQSTYFLAMAAAPFDFEKH